MTSQLALAFDAPAPKARRAAALRSFKARDESPAEALAGERRALGQEEILLAFFRDRPGERFTPWELTERFGICINSVRRALTQLTDRGDLIDHRTDRRPSGPYGQRSRTWSLP